MRQKEIDDNTQMVPNTWVDFLFWIVRMIERQCVLHETSMKGDSSMVRRVSYTLIFFLVLGGATLLWEASFFIFETGPRHSHAQSAEMGAPKTDKSLHPEGESSTRDANKEKEMGGKMGGMTTKEMRESMKDIIPPKEVPFYQEKTFIVIVSVALILLVFWVIKRGGIRPWRFLKKQDSYINEAILVVDLCESTKMAVTQGDVFAMRIKNKMKDCVREVAQSFRVKFLENIGDGYLVTFPTGSDAVRAAMKILQNADDYNKKAPEKEKIELRIGINYGELVLDERGGRHGAAINKVFRIEGIKKEQMQDLGEGLKPEEFLEKNRIFVSEEMKEEIKDMKDIRSQLVGVFDLKGFTGLHRIYYIPWKELSLDQ
jgi:class 3 adenylate cyclase